MRLIAQATNAYYPALPEAIAGNLRHSKIPDPPPYPKFKHEDVNILDPSAGEAKALVQLAEGLGGKDTYRKTKPSLWLADACNRNPSIANRFRYVRNK